MLLSLDHQFFIFINSWTGRYPVWDSFGVFCARYLIWLMVAIVLGWWLFLRRIKPSSHWPYEGKRKWLILGQIILSIGLVVLINQLLSFIHFRARPFINLTVTNLLGVPISQKSFPSDHAAISFTLALAVYLYQKKLGWLLLAVAVLVGFGRVFVGVHYPLDVIGGAVVAGLVVVTLHQALIKVIKK